MCFDLLNNYMEQLKLTLPTLLRVQYNRTMWIDKLVVWLVGWLVSSLVGWTSVRQILFHFQLIVGYFEAEVVTCCIQFWIREIGFYISYGALLLKTWR